MSSSGSRLKVHYQGDQVYRVVLVAICWVIWKARNKVFFDKKPIKDPVEIIFSACSFMRY
jgi:hypothetical protein